MNKDTVIVPISDLHSGGSTALFPKRFWQFQHTNHTPTDKQKLMFDHWVFCANEIKRARKGKRLIVIHNGDAIDGNHHNTFQVVTRQKSEQMDIHIDLMDYFLQTVGFDRRSDQLYYVVGTEVHTNDSEHLIGEDLGAVPCGDLFAWDELKLEVNGKRLWAVHHGPNPGNGANKGNTLRNWLKNNFFNQTSEGAPPPHYVFTGHYHDPCWSMFVARYKGEYHAIHGLISPSWQHKTRYAFRAAPMKKNKIGMQYVTITKEGLISDPVEMLMK